MNAEQMWQAYCEKENTQETFDAWSFGVEADLLADLVLKGIKTATASAYPLYEADGEELPQSGQYSVILNAREEAVCVIRTEKVFLVPFDQVDERHAWNEGEGDRSLRYWQEAHRRVFSAWMAEAGLGFTEKTEVVCEEFIRVFP